MTLTENTCSLLHLISYDCFSCSAQWLVDDAAFCQASYAQLAQVQYAAQQLLENVQKGLQVAVEMERLAAPLSFDHVVSIEYILAFVPPLGNAWRRAKTPPVKQLGLSDEVDMGAFDVLDHIRIPAYVRKPLSCKSLQVISARTEMHSGSAETISDNLDIRH